MAWTERIILAGRILWFYLGKLTWPQHICFVYPQWDIDATAIWQWLYPLGFAILMLLAWQGRNRLGRGPIAVILFYVGNLLPVLGFMNVYGMLYAQVADRWVYTPCLGIFALAGAGLALLATRVSRPWAAWGVGTALLSALGILTWQQAEIYRDPIALWTATLEKNPACWMAHANLGRVLVREGRVPEGREHLRRSLKIRPSNALVQTNLAWVLQNEGKSAEAEEHYQAALRADPHYGKAHRLYASLLIKEGRGGQAIVHVYAENIRRAQEKLGWGDLNSLAWTLATHPDPKLRHGNSAVELAEQANKISREHNPDVLKVLAAAYAEAGRFPEAVQAVERAMALANSDDELAGALKLQHKLYSEGKPFREESAVEAGKQASPR
jgi:tetratricopeptide (TPR) repeat protein